MEPNYGYKHTRGFLIFLLIIIVMALGAVYAQTSPNTPSGYSIDSVTGNLISNGSISSVSGWTVTTGSPTWTPVSPGGSFGVDGYTFGYGVESLGQNPSVNLSSFNHGYLNSSAVFVTGFMYGLKYRFPCANSIGTNCDGTAQAGFIANPTQDNLRVEVGYYPSTGSPTFYTHQLGLKNINDGNSPYNPSWQTLSQTVTFAGAKPLAQAGAVNYEIIGSDQGFWACNPNCYGPQVKDAYIRAIYSVDPCILNPAFNSSCAGFSNVLQGAKSPTFYYSYNIAQSLPHIGGGVVLHGYDYGFNWYNYGACYNTFLFWCTDWRTDGGGNINFRISDKNNTTMFQNQWYVSGNNNAGSFSSRHLFTESKNSLDMGSVQWWASDVWNHFGWVGWTRPIWTPDPCYTNGLYSPNCSNFQSTLTQVIADVKAQQERIAALTPATTSSSSSAPGGAITVTIENANGATPSVNVATAVNTSASNEPSATRSNTQFALSLVQANQRREQTIAQRASENARNEAIARADAARSEAVSVADANQQQGAAASDAAADAAQAANVPMTTNSVNTMAAQMNLGPVTNTTLSSISAALQPQLSIAQRQTSTPVEIVMPNEPTNTGSLISQVRAPEPQQNIVTQTTTVAAIITPYQSPQGNDIVQTPKQEPMLMTVPQVDLAVIDNRPQVTNVFRPTIPMTDSAPAPASVIIPESSTITQSTVVNPVEIKTTELDSIVNPANFITNRTNPITSIVEGRILMTDSNQPKTELSSVNRNVANNELAGGIGIETIALAPQGFNVYASLVLKDAAFYTPREIYRNQRTIDNVRALRNLAQDARHQEMIEQQYRR